MVSSGRGSGGHVVWAMDWLPGFVTIVTGSKPAGVKDPFFLGLCLFLSALIYLAYWSPMGFWGIN